MSTETKARKIYRVVENSGYENEYVWGTPFKSLADADEYVKRQYEPKEAEDLHVQIALETPDGNLTYDF